jgi:tetratricopeptide (TPR) repeat protein
LRESSGDVQKSLGLFKKSLSYNSFGNNETRERLVFEAIKISNKQIDQETKNTFRDFTIKEVRKQVEENPGDAKYPLFATSLFKSFGMFDEAKEMIDLAYKISPQKQIVLFELGSLYLDRGEYKEALEVFKKAYEISPGYEQAINRYGLAALYAGDEELAKEILVPIYGTYLLPDMAYINFFAKQNKFDVVKDLLIQMIEKEPKQPQYYFQLAGSYIELDEKDKALETLKEIGATFPELKGDADFYINEINNGNIK